MPLPGEEVLTGDRLLDQVLPLATTSRHDDGLRFEAFLGSCLRIGRRGVLLTAAHVVPPRIADVAALIVTEQGWEGRALLDVERHPTEDVAVLRVEEMPWRSFLQLGGGHYGQGLHYRQLAYPADVARELVDRGRVVPRPDLVYIEGYVRRRMTGIALPAIHGHKLYELSTAAGLGASGSPLLTITAGAMWDVVGIYIGQRLTEGLDPVRIGYDTRVEAFRDWRPAMLSGKSLVEESLSVS